MRNVHVMATVVTACFWGYVTCSLQDGWSQLVSEVMYCMMTAFKTGFWGSVGRLVHFGCDHNCFVTLCQTFVVQWIQLRLVCEVMSNDHCMITATTTGLYQIGWPNDNYAELNADGGFLPLSSVRRGKFRDSARIRTLPLPSSPFFDHPNIRWYCAI
jgi:hypothetical protein